MNTSEAEVQCPYCGEPIVVVVDLSQDEQDYIEDCSVCCRPIEFKIRCQEGELVAVEAGRS